MQIHVYKQNLHIVFFHCSYVANSLIEVMEVLLCNKNAKFVLSNRFSQDTLEIYFGQQQSQGHRNDNHQFTVFTKRSSPLSTEIPCTWW